MNPPNEKRNRQVVILKEQGLSFSEIGNICKITKQTAHNIYNRDKDKYSQKTPSAVVDK